ncbi:MULTISPECIES: deoxyribodipyrimidine photo-lyase [unclassified Lentimonas]|uniref:cryptochrome/photolyase family protein n=1 Tax=unclassified Lentimonas TaxID=2630993 RepID=UPI001326DBAB|nr:MULTISPECIES: deoxyribodipyrimidine photo-lyase [unclassified Lentimonas]CAA6690129.1 Deoxyribodipyrimidine photolyase (EC [Lentimonas sp. CC19]CAA6690909.1 Deoxyribodipyrimidine photolyase (EC [Lentimonas sp. CC10]CAA7070739.1 Deoxyribodipyrimidine photolyase (EC [Lentimonas sp. CC11]
MLVAPTILCFRNDLRLADNSALAAAIAAGAPVIPVFIWSPEECAGWAPGGASKWWLHHALKSLSRDLELVGGALILRQGQSLSVLRELIQATGAGRVFWNRRYAGELRTVDAEVKRALRADGVEVQSFNSSLLNEPHTVAAGAGQAYKVYTPYWKKVKGREIEPPVVADFEHIQWPSDWPLSDGLVQLQLLPKLNWADGMEKCWDVSEASAQQRLNAFVAGPIDAYHVDRDRPDFEGTSSLAPYLQWGLIGPRQIVQTLKDRCDLSAEGPQVYLKEIYWREFAYNVLYHFPYTADCPLRLEYEDFPWETDAATLKAWQTGQTGYPIVDAGMRQLWQTGWMHNRVRMVVSSLLVKHLLQSWQDGARWFWDTLVDADLASNTLGWQWSGGCGADAAPYFRVFNPILQGKKFDPDGAYVKKYVPELRGLDVKYIHEPWDAPSHVLERAGIRIGDTYPAPLIDHKAGRERALAALAQFKK